MAFEMIRFEGGQSGVGPDYNSIVGSALARAQEAGTMHVAVLSPRREPYILPAPTIGSEIEVWVREGQAVCKSSVIRDIAVRKGLPVATMEMQDFKGGLFHAVVYSLVRCV